METLSINREVASGETDKKMVTLIQEWLSLNGEKVKIDGDFGPATGAAVISFQKKNGLPQTGVVNPFTFSLLVEPLRYATARTLNSSEPLPDATLKIALHHFEKYPREVGGNNMGPWVRHYMDGLQGEDYPWCAGFITTCMQQAAGEMQISPALKKTYSCDNIGNWAIANKKFIAGSAADLTAVKPGHFFLVRRTSTDWTHTGIVVEMNSDYCKTIEGNTNDEGSREGYEVCLRKRSFKNLDFVTY